MWQGEVKNSFTMSPLASGGFREAVCERAGGAAYWSALREIVIDASVFVRTQRMSRRR